MVGSIDLSGADLTNAELSNVDLSNVDLHDATLGNADLSYANLRNANLNYAELVESILDHADLSQAQLHNAKLNRAHLIEAKLYEAVLKNTRLVEADLNSANLQWADLSEADLSWADLNRTDLQWANLRGANLSKATLTRVIFREADLSGADLSGADLSEVILSDANLENAILSKTKFYNLDLSLVKGLSTVIHNSPSVIDINTFYVSKGNIPEVFLRGAGVPEDFFAFLSALRGKPIEFYSCFISYSHADKNFARRLHDGLQSRGIRCWLDEHKLLPGDDIFEQVDRGIRLWDKVLLCCSKDSLNSWWVDDEITRAFKKEQEMLKERGRKVLALIPLNLDGYMWRGDWPSPKATQLKSRLAADFTGWEHDNARFEQQFELVLKALRADGSGREEPPVPKL
jgi:uncharacterized protein YjbI with pentapeptide repeats